MERQKNKLNAMVNWVNLNSNWKWKGKQILTVFEATRRKEDEKTGKTARGAEAQNRRGGPL